MKSRRLATLGHDLRQPLQAMILIEGLLAKTPMDEAAQRLVARLGQALGAMADLVNALPDIDETAPATLGAIELAAAPDQAGAADLVHRAEAAGSPAPPVVYVVDDDSAVRSVIRAVLRDAGRSVEDYPSCEAFLAAWRPGGHACLLLDAYLPGMSGLDLLERLHRSGHRLPTIMITGSSDVPTAVQAMKIGALDFIEKPIGRDDLLASIDRALELAKDTAKLSVWRQDAARRVAGLTPRQRQIMGLVLAGHPSKIIAADLGISQRTVETHRASIMTRTGAGSLPELARLALAADLDNPGEPPR